LNRAVLDTGADIIGVTVMPGPQLNSAFPLCRQLRALHPAVKIIWGGYFPTQHPESCLRSGCVDFVVRGCGEFAFEILVGALRSGCHVSEIPSLAYIDPEIQAIVSTPPSAIPDPDALPEYPYHRIDTSRYIRKSFLGERTMAHHSSYGCPFSCDFCAVAQMAEGKWTAQSADRLAASVSNLVTLFEADAVEFYDNAFFVSEARTAEFARRIQSLGIRWWGEAPIDTLLKYSDQTWDLMRASGLKMVFMGAESGSDAVLKRMNKGGSASVENTLAVAEKMKHYGMVPEFSFVLGNPPDPEADIHGTLDFIRQVKKVNRSAEIILYLYAPVPSKGELFSQARSQGFLFPETLEEWTGPEWRAFSERRSLRVPWLHPRLVRRVHDFECVLNAYYPTTTNPRLRGFRKWVLRTAGAWRYRLGVYGYPLELKLLQKLFAYQRPETSGF
jgi:radical SAM superfamily enzyme YgiQ (UPF0313 family)